MAGAYTQEGRLLSFSSSALGKDVLLADAFQGVEAVSELFCFDVELLSSPDMSINPASIVGFRASIQIVLDTHGEKRYFNGVVSSFVTEGGNPDFIRHKVRLRPALWLLSLNTQTRVFQNKTVVQIVELVLEPYSIAPVNDTKGSYTALEYCTQYRETDLEFVSRLLQQHGIFYYFTHTESDHLIVLADDVTTSSKCPVEDTYQFRSGQSLGAAAAEPMIEEFSAESQLIPGKYTSWDFRFIPYEVSEADMQQSSVPMGKNGHEFRDYADSASGYLKTEDGDAKAVADATAHSAQGALRGSSRRLPRIFYSQDSAVRIHLSAAKAS